MLRCHSTCFIALLSAAHVVSANGGGTCKPRAEYPPPTSRLPGFFLALFLVTVALAASAFSKVSSYTRATRRRNRSRRAKLLALLGKPKETVIIGFLHPYCNAGGGGERVLFQAIAYHQRQGEDVVCIVYTGDVGPEASLLPKNPRRRGGGAPSSAGDKAWATKEEILDKAQTRFNITLSPASIHFVPLSSRQLVDDGYWTRLTLLGQSFGSALLASEAMSELIPDVFIDTMGYAFTYPVVRLFSPDIPMGAYVHYPTISTDMLQRVRSRQAGHTNDPAVAGSVWKSRAKLVYYRTFAWLYSRALRSADVLVANGSWTKAHLNTFLLSASTLKAISAGTRSATPKENDRMAQTLYPPCDTASLQHFPLEGREMGRIVSLAQFRPEKEHATQLRFLRALLDTYPEHASKVELTLMGSSRNEGDEKRIQGLRSLSEDLKLQEHVTFLINAPYSIVLENLSQASIGLSTMVDEHFGINVVEFMAAGLVTLSHASAGPLMDIAVPVDGRRTGFHATTIATFADAAHEILTLPSDEVLAMRQRARQRAVDTFGSDAFEKGWEDGVWGRLIEVARRKGKAWAGIRKEAESR